MKRFWIFALLMVSAMLMAQPIGVGGGKVEFSYTAPNANAVYLSGGFNRWEPTATPMEKTKDGVWKIILEFEPGIHQYKFVVNGKDWIQDPNNSAAMDDNYGGLNSVFVLKTDGSVVLESQAQGPVNPDDTYPNGPKVHLAIIWHQHQPLYADPVEDYLRGPWVRLHATKDYYDMASMLADYPKVHTTFNLTSVLLQQLQNYYVERLAPVVDGDRVDEAKFAQTAAGRTDPWIDLLIKDTKNFDAQDNHYLTGGSWNAFGISEVMIERFPEYKALRDKGADKLTVDDKLQLKVWFALAWFDPDFLNGSVELITGDVVDLSDLVEKRGDRWFARRKFTEDDANRIVAESYKVMAAVVPIHKQIITDGRGEMITTPYYHPILPLLFDSDIAKVCQPGTPMPARFNYPEDAMAQVLRGGVYYRELFGSAPKGMWPAEGSVSEQVVPIFAQAGIRWIATADGVLYKSTPPNQPIWRPYRVDADREQGTSNSDEAVAVFFRDTELSDRIGFKYQTKPGEEAAEDFVQKVLSYAQEGEDRLITVILDGENAWEWYRTSPDAKEFLHAMYRKLEKLYDMGRVVTVSPMEYIAGNPDRGVEPHPIMEMPELEPLWPGSWINANYDTWIGESEENIAWELLGQVRAELAQMGLEQPDPLANPPSEGKELAAYNAWEAIYAAEGSDWFWWFGDDQGAPGGDEPFDEAFRTHLTNVYRYARNAGVDVEVPEFAPILRGTSSGGGGTMAQNKGPDVEVRFVVDASAQKVSDAIYIVGAPPELGEWTPNKIQMFDDGTHGDEKAGDGKWSLTATLPEGSYIEYKYTNSGKEGQWQPGEEFPMANRTIAVKGKNGAMTVRDVFGEM
ncbi:MAG: carbohydrate-binding module family 20 domain-containing protein [bacterium]